MPSQDVQVGGQVNNFAEALLTKRAGDGAFVQNDPVMYTLNLGTLQQGEPSALAELGVINDVLAPADDLNGTWSIMAADFNVSGFNPISDMATSSTMSGLSVEIETVMLGSFAGTIVLHPVGTNAGGFSGALPDVSIHLLGNIVPVPEPASFVLMLLGLVCVQMRRCRS